MNKPITLFIPQKWLDQLELLAKLRSIKENNTTSIQDLILDTLNTKYSLGSSYKVTLTTIGSATQPATKEEITNTFEVLNRQSPFTIRL